MTYKQFKKVYRKNRNDEDNFNAVYNAVRKMKGEDRAKMKAALQRDIAALDHILSVVNIGFVVLTLIATIVIPETPQDLMGYIMMVLVAVAIIGSSPEKSKCAFLLSLIESVEQYDMDQETEDTQYTEDGNKEKSSVWLENFIVSNKGKFISAVLGGIIVFIGIPLMIVGLTSFDVIPANCDNDWIGFWGGYLGSIIGGITTLYVMYYTIRDNKKNVDRTLENERNRNFEKEKKLFDDEILEAALDYHIRVCAISSILRKGKIKTEVWESFQKSSAMAQLLIIKLSSKKEEDGYMYCKELSGCIENIDKNFNEMVRHMADKEEGVYEQRKDELGKLLPLLRKEIKQYYAENQMKQYEN